MKRILFLGGANFQIPAIEEAKRMGLYVITCDYLPNNPGHKLADEYYNVSTVDIPAVLRLAEKIKPDIIMAYASDPGAPVAAFVSEKYGLPSNPYAVVRNLSEKDLFRGFLQEHNFNVPRSMGLDESEIDTSLLDDFIYPLIVKPVDASGSKGVMKILEPSELKIASKYALSLSRKRRIIIEEFVFCDGEQLHGDGFVINGNLAFYYLGDHHYNHKVNQFVPYCTTWPSKKAKTIIDAVGREVAMAVKCVGLQNGPINIEARVSVKGEIYIMEIGPRSGGNFVPQAIKYATGFDMIKSSLDILMGNIIKIPILEKGCSAYYVVHSTHDGKLSKLSLSEKVMPYVKEFHQYKKFGEHCSSFQGADAAIGVILLAFDNTKEMNNIIDIMPSLIDLVIE